MQNLGNVVIKTTQQMIPTVSSNLKNITRNIKVISKP